MSEEVYDYEKVLANDAKEKDNKLYPDETVNEYFKRKHPDWPPIHINLFLSQHLNDSDLQNIGTEIENADIYFAENARGDDFAKSLQKVSERDKNDEIKTKNPIIHAVHGTNVVVGHMDLLPGDPIERIQYHELIDAQYIVPDFDETLHNLENKAKAVQHFQDVREEIMVNRFRDEMERIMDAYPDLRKKDQLKVLSTIGSLHTTLFHKFKDEGLDTNRKFSHSPYVYDYTIQLMRAIAYGNVPDKKLLSRAYLTNIITDAMIETMDEDLDDPTECFTYTRYICDQFSPDEIKKLHEATINNDSAEPLNTLLQEKGIGQLPTTNEEIRAYNQQNQKSKEKHIPRRMQK